jgi:molecular chaperone Hsp33
MTDHLAKATASGVRAFAAVTTTLCEEARRRHDCYPVAAAALGRTMTAALLLAANLKDEGAITIRIDGDGPLGKVVADASPRGYVRGYVANPHADLPLNKGKINVGGGVGDGLIHVSRFSAQKEENEAIAEEAHFTRLNQPFTGSVPLVSGEIGEDVANYLLVSEQTPSTVALGVLVNPDLTVAAAGGFIVQAMPGADDAVLAQIEQNLTALPPVSQLVRQGEDAAAILNRIFAGMPCTVFEPAEVAFYCHCCVERIEGMLLSLGRKELAEMVLEGQAEVRCHFCGELYNINRARLKELHDSSGV